MPRYFAHVSQLGSIRYGSFPTRSGCLRRSTSPCRSAKPIARTWDENGLAVWTLRIGKHEIAGQWIIVDREFRLAE